MTSGGMKPLGWFGVRLGLQHTNVGDDDDDDDDDDLMVMMMMMMMAVTWPGPLILMEHVQLLGC